MSGSSVSRPQLSRPFGRLILRKSGQLVVSAAGRPFRGGSRPQPWVAAAVGCGSGGLRHGVRRCVTSGPEPADADQSGEGDRRRSGRRAFLILAGVAAGATGVSYFLHAASEPDRPAATRAASAGTSASAHASASANAKASRADWQALRRRLSTDELVLPGQAGYTTARQLFDPRFDAVEPAGIAYCGTPQDVSACLAFVRRFGLPVAARSGGHSYGGWSSSTGLIVDVSRMNTLRVAAGGATVQVGTGTRLVDFYSGLAARGLAVPGGSCPTVGVAGLTLGGGIGVLSRQYGLTSAHLEAVHVVTADGTIRD